MRINKLRLSKRIRKYKLIFKTNKVNNRERLTNSDTGKTYSAIKDSLKLCKIKISKIWDKDCRKYKNQE